MSGAPDTLVDFHTGRDVSGDWAIGPDDSVAGVEHALATYAWLDPGKVVGLGASYGGFSMNYLNGNAPKDMFCALVNHDGLFDMRSGSVWKSTSVSGAPDNSSLSHFSAMTLPSWLGRAEEPASPRHQAGVASMAWRTMR